ncbi:hypothetical protein Vqi01_12970 [Micromonospora qiuiae]|uniref:Uncharacterized protein n=1 Tax=Micromonospora qiuiae TaxID=502268 RepID=A0ABQ4J830_9ACTN|nr:hypothetical protein Vqi01_12970 [Micromonospora qiuiae]
MPGRGVGILSVRGGAVVLHDGTSLDRVVRDLEILVSVRHALGIGVVPVSVLDVVPRPGLSAAEVD